MGITWGSMGTWGHADPCALCQALGMHGYLEDIVHVSPIYIVANVAQRSHRQPQPRSCNHEVAVAAHFPGLLAGRGSRQRLEQLFPRGGVARWQDIHFDEDVQADVPEGDDIGSLIHLTSRTTY